MTGAWVIWSEEHGGWWMAGSLGYTQSLRRAGRYTEKQAKLIENTANRYLPEGRVNEVAMPDPWKGRQADERDRRSEWETGE